MILCGPPSVPANPFAALVCVAYDGLWTNWISHGPVPIFELVTALSPWQGGPRLCGTRAEIPYSQGAAYDAASLLQSTKA